MIKENKPLFDLKEKRLKRLASIKEIKKVIIGDTFYDDHMPCFNVSFKDQNNRAYKISLWWTEEALVGHFEYAEESTKAQKKAIEYLRYTTKEEIKARKEIRRHQ